MIEWLNFAVTRLGKDEQARKSFSCNEAIDCCCKKSCSVDVLSSKAVCNIMDGLSKRLFLNSLTCSNWKWKVLWIVKSNHLLCMQQPNSTWPNPSFSIWVYRSVQLLVDWKYLSHQMCQQLLGLQSRMCHQQMQGANKQSLHWGWQDEVGRR